MVDPYWGHEVVFTQGPKPGLLTFRVINSLMIITSGNLPMKLTFSTLGTEDLNMRDLELRLQCLLAAVVKL